MKFVQALTRQVDAGELEFCPNGTAYDFVIGCWARVGEVCSLRGLVAIKLHASIKQIIGLMAACSSFGTTLLGLHSLAS